MLFLTVPVLRELGWCDAKVETPTEWSGMLPRVSAR